MYKHILIPTDGSELAERAVAEGVKLASAIGARLTFCYVIVPLRSLGDYDHAFASEPEPVRRQAVAFLKAESTAALDRASSLANAAGLAPETISIENVHPYEAIIEVAGSTGADLIVMASHGRGGSKALILGSVTQKILSHTQLPVLVVR